MTNVADSYHLQNRRGIWYYVRRVPPNLQSMFGAAVVKKSLHTSNKAEAKKRRTIEDVSFDARVANFLDGENVSSEVDAANVAEIDDLLDYVRLAVSARDKVSAKSLVTDPPKNAWERQDLSVDADIEFQILDDPDDPRRDMAIHNFIARVTKDAGVSIPASLRPEAWELGRRALIELSRRRIDRYADRFDRPYFDPAFAPQSASLSFQNLTKEFLKEIAEEHDANSIGMQRREKVQGFVASILEIVGPSVRVGKLDDETVQRVRSVLAKLPTNRTKIYGDLPLKDVLSLAAAEARPTLSATTQADYLRVFKLLMKFAVRRKYLALDPSIEAKPLTKAVPLEERKMPFTLNQLRAFFTSEFYKRCAPGAGEPYAKADRDWRFWFPLIMIFSATRPNEIAQLSAADVRKSAGGNCYFNFMPVGGMLSKKLKNHASRRRIPLHSELLAMGFLAFVEKRESADGKNAALFPTLKPNRFGNLAWYANRRFNEVFLPSVIEVQDDQSFYSFRHSVRDALRRAKAIPEALRAIGGWTEYGRSTSDYYGDATDPDLYVEWVNSISYPGLDLSFLHV